MRDPQRDSPPEGGRQPSPESYGEWLALLPSLKLMISLLTMAVVIAALYFGQDVLIPLALAILLGFLLDPLVTALKRIGLPRVVAVFVVVGGLLLLLSGVSLLLGQQVRMLSEELPTYQSTIRTKVRDIRESFSGASFLEGAKQTFDTVEREIKKPDESAPKAAPVPEEAPPQPVVVQEPQPSAVEQAVAWLSRISSPVATAGIVLLFLVLILLARNDLRDRILRLMGGNLHRSTDAMDEASRRISRYLTMQLVVNVTYAIPMGLGLWLIGIPGAILWGVLAAILRFIPYAGPAISAVFPIVLAFGVDPGWDILLWTIGLIAVLELISNNVIEPWLYGASTGISTISLISAMLFWTALWGPVGLMLSTPLTVCLLVLGRYLPQFQFLEVLLGSEPVLDAPTRLYQRLLAGDVEEAIDMATEEIERMEGMMAHPVLGFYDQIGIPTLRRASGDYANVASAEHRMRMLDGMTRLIGEMREQYPAELAADATVLCVGGRWEADALAANMLAHALALQGHAARHLAGMPVVTSDFLGQFANVTATTVCLSYFSPAPEAHVRYLSRRLRRRWPGLRIVVGLWNASPDLLNAQAVERLGVDAVAASLDETVLQITSVLGHGSTESVAPAPEPEDEAARMAAVRATGVLDRLPVAGMNVAAQRAADIFDVQVAMVTLVDESWVHPLGISGRWPALEGDDDRPGMAREVSPCAHVVAGKAALYVADIARDPRFASPAGPNQRGLRFYAGAPLRDKSGQVFGSLCLYDDEPRLFDEKERKLLQALADEAMRELTEQLLTAAADAETSAATDTDGDAPSGAIAQ